MIALKKWIILSDRFLFYTSQFISRKEPVPEHDTIEGSLSDVLEIPSITDWLAKNPALKWGAMTGAIALAFLAAQAFNNEQN
ncbi:MAG TPA: hypothetical protein V6C90_27265 [Coleofasciculaceae cyanobacterium]